MDNVVGDVSAFLINTLFDIYLIVVLLRILLALVGADFYNPFSQLVVSLTDPLIRPFRKVLPSVGGIDAAGLVLLLVLKLVQLTLLALVAGIPLSPLALLRLSFVQLLQLLVYIYIFAIIVQAVMSWFMLAQHPARHPLVPILSALTRPVLDPLRRILPMFGAIDLSPMVALLVLNVFLIVLQAL